MLFLCELNLAYNIIFFFFNDRAPTEIYPLPLHDSLPISTTRRLLVNSSGRAQIKPGQSCGVSVPLTAILYGTAGTVVQVVRRARVETRRVETGLMSAGQVEITSGIAEGDTVVARAGALLREGGPVRAVTASADAK